MRAVVQRVHQAEVRVNDECVGRIDAGLLVYLGSADGDSPDDQAYIVEKLAGLRIFPDDQGKMNRSVAEVGGGILIVPAFTTLADARQGRRPAFVNAARPESAEPAFLAVVAAMAERGLVVQSGRFREHMDVHSTNDGPICILLDSRRVF